MLKQEIANMLAKWGHPRTDTDAIADKILYVVTYRARELYKAGQHAGASGYTRVGLGDVSELENIIHGFGVANALLRPATDRLVLDDPNDPAFGVRKFMQHLTAVVVDAARAMGEINKSDVMNLPKEVAGRMIDLGESVQNLDDAISYSLMPEAHTLPDPAEVIQPEPEPVNEALTEQQQLWRALAELGSRVQDLALVQKQILDKLYLLEIQRSDKRTGA